MSWERIARRMVKSNRFIRQRKHKLSGKLIISLTSFTDRFKTLPLTLDCLLSQTIKPDKIILWLEEKDNPTNHIKYKDVEIQRVKCDIKSYNKIIHALKKYPEAYIAIADDDAYYPPQWLENMIVPLYQYGDQYAYAHRVHRIQLKNGKPKPYRRWKIRNREIGPHPLNLQTGVGGVLYPPGILHSDVLDKSLFMSLCPHADDLWLYWQLRRQGGEAYHVPTSLKDFGWPGTQESSLKQENFYNGGNDKQIQNLINYYGFPND